MKQSLARFVGAIGLALLPSLASAANYEAPVAANAYITKGGLNWAWAYPLADGLDLGYQSAFGWRLPTPAELIFAPVVQDFMFAGANVPLYGTDPVSGSMFQYTDASLTGDAACAAAYFSSVYYHCDWGNGPGSLNDPQPWAGQPGAVSYSEALVVREVAPVPIPAAAGLLAAGLGTLGLIRRRRAQ